MVKYFCDCCSAETNFNELRLFEYCCHLEEETGYVVLIDQSLVPISSRPVTKQLCIRCYNDIVGNAVLMLKNRTTEEQAKTTMTTSIGTRWLNKR